MSDTPTPQKIVQSSYFCIITIQNLKMKNYKDWYAILSYCVYTNSNDNLLGVSNVITRKQMHGHDAYTYPSYLKNKENRFLS